MKSTQQVSPVLVVVSQLHKSHFGGLHLLHPGLVIGSTFHYNQRIGQYMHLPAGGSSKVVKRGEIFASKILLVDLFARPKLCRFYGVQDGVQ
jgi:hypothetical protein